MDRGVRGHCLASAQRHVMADFNAAFGRAQTQLLQMEDCFAKVKVLILWFVEGLLVQVIVHPSVRMFAGQHA